jgi:hypothetical protein
VLLGHRQLGEGGGGRGCEHLGHLHLLLAEALAVTIAQQQHVGHTVARAHREQQHRARGRARPESTVEPAHLDAIGGHRSRPPRQQVGQQRKPRHLQRPAREGEPRRRRERLGPALAADQRQEHGVGQPEELASL